MGQALGAVFYLKTESLWKQDRGKKENKKSKQSKQSKIE